MSEKNRFWIDLGAMAFLVSMVFLGVILLLQQVVKYDVWKNSRIVRLSPTFGHKDPEGYRFLGEGVKAVLDYKVLRCKQSFDLEKNYLGTWVIINHKSPAYIQIQFITSDVQFADVSVRDDRYSIERFYEEISNGRHKVVMFPHKPASRYYRISELKIVGRFDERRADADSKKFNYDVEPGCRS